MRDGFREIVSGWTLISGMQDISDRIERVAKWSEANGPLEPDEEATVKVMIDAQVARGIARGDFEPYFHADDDDDGDPNEDDFEFDCHLGRDGQCGKAGSEECDWECPMRNSEFFAGSAAWNAKHQRQRRS